MALIQLDRYTRWQAAPAHLVISAVIAAIVFSTMMLLWYPRPYFSAAGGATLMMLLIGVNVVIGPLLTLIVFDPKKKSLRMDLAIIALLQVAALVYGAWVMFNARPVYLAYADDRFELVAANQIADTDLDKAAFEYRALPLTGPRLVGTRLPADPVELENLGLATVLGGSIGLFPQHYIPYATVSREVVLKAKPLKTLRQRNPEHVAEIDAFVAGVNKPETSLRYLPLHARQRDMTVIVDEATGSVQGVIEVDPW